MPFEYLSAFRADLQPDGVQDPATQDQDAAIELGDQRASSIPDLMVADLTAAELGRRRVPVWPTESRG